MIKLGEGDEGVGGKRGLSGRKWWGYEGTGRRGEGDEGMRGGWLRSYGKLGHSDRRREMSGERQQPRQQQQQHVSSSSSTSVAAARQQQHVSTAAAAWSLDSTSKLRSYGAGQWSEERQGNKAIIEKSGKGEEGRGEEGRGEEGRGEEGRGEEERGKEGRREEERGEEGRVEEGKGEEERGEEGRGEEGRVEEGNAIALLQHMYAKCTAFVQHAAIVQQLYSVVTLIALPSFPPSCLRSLNRNIFR
ncbi:hypothetical protein HAZT_HAZT000304 [Hyalella azteca]|uniref:Uncharacterized protein n=1 Tax=Hyalella azteca TaxID=294128 RepID=A0A6A0H6Q9_HYAAZ|nr:hypothetical protein HAZT_HAZT000304 [Hyalella azteca]